MSHKWTFRSYPQQPNKFRLCGLHWTFTTLSLFLKLAKDLVKFLISQRETVSSPDPLRNKNSLKGEKSREYTSFVWAMISNMGFPFPEPRNLKSQIIIIRSSEQLAKIFGCILCQAISYTGAAWWCISKMGKILLFSDFALSISQIQILLSLCPEPIIVGFTGFQLKPKPYWVWQTNRRGT